MGETAWFKRKCSSEATLKLGRYRLIERKSWPSTLKTHFQTVYRHHKLLCCSYQNDCWAFQFTKLFFNLFEM